MKGAVRKPKEVPVKDESVKKADDKKPGTTYSLVHLSVIVFAIAGFIYYGNRGRGDLQWWQTTIVYQIYPRSFQDSDGDGVGDLKGIISRLDHFEYLNVKSIWLSPFFNSPMKDFGYDISNHTDVDPIFGTLSDFDEMVRESHKKGIKVMIDFVPNHVSDQHHWFKESVKGTEKYRDYFMWTDGKIGPDGKPQPPNNWLGVFGGDCWRWNENRKQFYYHAFVKEQPDLNYRNPDVVNDMNLTYFGGGGWQWSKTRKQFYYHAFIREQPDLNYRNPEVVRDMDDVVRFWMERGVDGIRVDAIMKLFESVDIFQDEPRSNLPGIPEYEYLNHIHTENLPEIGDIVRGWRNIMDEYEAKDGTARFMIVELYDPPAVRNKYYDYGSMPFNFDLVMDSDADCGGSCLRNILEKEYANLPPGAWPKFVLGNHDRKRVSKRYGVEYVSVYNMLLLTVKGTPTTYYGEELGMEEISVSFKDTQDPWGLNFGEERYTEFSRDPVRSPMQWDSSSQAGFTSSSKPWLPVDPGYKTLNVKVQKDNEDSPLQIYRHLAKLREEEAFQKPDVTYAVVNDNILSYIRGTDGTGRYLVIMNFGHSASTDDYTESPVRAKFGEIVLTTGNLHDQKFQKGKRLSLNKITLKPNQGVILKI